MLIVTAALLTLGALLFTVVIREKDLTPPEPVSPVQHLEERKATIYDNLRDLQFEYRVGKLSDQDYKQTTQDLQRELAAVLAEIDGVQPKGAPPAAAPAPAPSQPATGLLCPHCGAKFASPLKFCGECGKPMTGASR